MYKSSQLTIIFKYFFPVIMITFAILGILKLWTSEIPESHDFAKGFIFMAIWVSIFLVQMPFRLKSVETTEQGLLIKDFGKKMLIDYRDVHWISKYDITCPWAITIKYRDKDSEKDKKVSYMPGQSTQQLFKNDTMTQYIMDQIKAHNPDYSKDDQPSAFKNMIITTLLGLPFLLAFLYFSGFLDKFFK